MENWRQPEYTHTQAWVTIFRSLNRIWKFYTIGTDSLLIGPFQIYCACISRKNCKGGGYIEKRGGKSGVVREQTRLFPIFSTFVKDRWTDCQSNFAVSQQYYQINKQYINKLNDMPLTCVCIKKLEITSCFVKIFFNFHINEICFFMKEIILDT